MTNLTILNLENNRLATLPLEVAQLENLMELKLDHNPLTAMPIEFKLKFSQEKARLVKKFLRETYLPTK